MLEKNKKIFKMFRTEVKAVDDKEGIIDMLIPMSTDSVDRSNESINPMGWKKSLPAFRKRAILVSSHSYNDLRKQIGELIEIKVVPEGLLARPKYYINQGNEEADWGFKLASRGMAAYSVGFIPIKWEDGDGKKKPLRTFTEQELLEISHVIVPCNRDAIQEMKGKSEDPVINKVIDDVLKEAGFIEIIEEEKAKYNCECIKCKYKMTSDKHCKDIKCPRCGGTMRREERPGPGEGTNMIDAVISEKELVTKPEETDELIRIPVKGEEGKHKGHKIRWINVSTKEGIRGIYCIDCKKIVTYVFEKKKGWTMAKAKKWMEDHGKMVCDYFLNIDPDTFKDLEAEEINWDEVRTSIEKEEEEGIAEAEKSVDNILKIYEMVKENKELKIKLKDLELKAGAVLNAKNKKDLKNAQGLIQSVLDSAGDIEEDGKNVDDDKKDDKGDDGVIELITDTVDNTGTDKEKDKAPDKSLDTYEVDDKKIAKIINDKIDYVTGRTVKTK